MSNSLTPKPLKFINVSEFYAFDDPTPISEIAQREGFNGIRVQHTKDSKFLVAQYIQMMPDESNE